MSRKMFDLENYIKISRSYLTRDDNGKIVAKVDVDIDTDEMSKEVEELRESLLNIRKILGYDFALIVSENNIKVMKELE